jgi:outer membrane murein-binding lipoprotein Lpp
MEPRAITEHGGRSQQTIENIGRRWWRGRDDLLVFGVANPSREIASASQALAADVARLWTTMTSLNRALQAAGGSGGQVDANLLDRACSDHEHATSAAQALEELSRE